MSSIDTCSICLQNIEIPTLVSVTHDGQDHNHVFHARCIHRWMLQQRRNLREGSELTFTCPICVGKITHLNGVPILREAIPPLITAVRNRNTETIREIVSNVQGISEAVYLQALREAAENVELLRVLLIPMLPPENRQRAREEAIQYFSSRGFLEVVQVLLVDTEEELSARSRGRAVVQASKWGHEDIVRTLLANGPIAEKYRGRAVVLAASRGDLATVQALLDNGPISIEHSDKAGRWAIRHGHDRIAQLLSEHRPSRENHPS